MTACPVEIKLCKILFYYLLFLNRAFKINVTKIMSPITIKIATIPEIIYLRLLTKAIGLKLLNIINPPI